MRNDFSRFFLGLPNLGRGGVWKNVISHATVSSKKVRKCLFKYNLTRRTSFLNFVPSSLCVDFQLDPYWGVSGTSATRFFLCSRFGLVFEILSTQNWVPLTNPLSDSVQRMLILKVNEGENMDGVSLERSLVNKLIKFFLYCARDCPLQKCTFNWGVFT